MLQLKSVQKQFKGNEVLKGVDMQILPGQLIHIKGRNGSGKSTLLKIIAKLWAPDSGEVIFNPNVVVGALIENPNFIESESLAYNLKFLYSLTKRYDDNAINKIRTLCELFHLKYDQKTAMKKYSLGMRQKAGIIQAVMEDQNLILLDEPTRGLDEDSMDAFRQLLQKLIQNKKSVVICAHDGVEEIPFTHIYELKNGILYE